MADFVRAHVITVVLTGDGGDGCFGSCPHYTIIGRIAPLLRAAGAGGSLAHAAGAQLPGRPRRLAPLFGLAEDSDLAMTLPEVLLIKMDRAAMSRSIECRSPFARRLWSLFCAARVYRRTESAFLQAGVAAERML
jgi:asparagine synthetase B (glutamine-hydrolysing)